MKNKAWLSAIVVALALAAGADTTNNGTFKFLTQSLPDGTSNAQYAARFITVNADGPVTFTNLSALPAGLSLDPISGFLTGIPRETFNKTITVVADDTTQQIQFNVSLKINAAGGGGNGGASFVNRSLALGRIGTVYTEQLTITNGVGPFTFGASDLPPGISLNGQTGVLSGNPTAAGRYFVTFSAYDEGEGNNSATVLPILVLPNDSDFQFITQSLNNGEVGTPYSDVYHVTNALGDVTFATSGLPPGLTLDRHTGVVSGTPTNAGTFEVLISASDNHRTITCNLGMLIAPSATNHFYWNVFSLPPGLLGVAYNRQPPILVATVNGGSVTYNATGLPPGINYNTMSGELTGTPTEIGEFDTLFTASDSSSGELLTLQFRFVILPTTGGDISSVPVNFWLTKQKLSLGVDGNESWAGTLLFNADRRSATRFNALTNDLSLALGSRTLGVPAGSLSGTAASMKYATLSGTIPSESVKLSLSKQTIQWKTSRDSIAATVPGLHDVILKMGSESYRTAVQFNGSGGANAIAAVRPSFVLAKGKLSAGTSADSVSFGMLLSDASFVYQTGDTLRVRLLQGASVLVDRDFTALGTGLQSIPDQFGNLVFTVRTLPDAATTNRISKFSYTSSNGKLALAMSGLTLAGLTNGQAHLTIELTFGERIYTTGVTFFGLNPGPYSTVMR